MNINILKIAKAAEKSGHSRSQFYNKIKEGLMPPPFKIGVKSSAWAEHEIAAVNLARFAGKAEEEIKLLVASLVRARSNVWA